MNAGLNDEKTAEIRHIGVTVRLTPYQLGSDSLLLIRSQHLSTSLYSAALDNCDSDTAKHIDFFVFVIFSIFFSFI